jgi:hypothetical protein
MTSKPGVKKFEELFKSKGIKKYEIVHDVQGKEKVDFIKSAKIAFLPSRNESFGYMALEAACACPTFLLEEFEWYKHHKEYVKVVPRSYILEELNKEYKSTLAYETPKAIIEREASVPEYWNKIMLPIIEPNKKTKEILQTETTLKNYFFSRLDRKVISYSDLQTIYRSCYNTDIYIKHENWRTIMSLSPIKDDVEISSNLEFE